MWLFVLSIVSNVLALALPLALLQVYDRILPSAEYGTAVTLFLAVVVAMVLDGFLRFVRTRSVSRRAVLAEHREAVALAHGLLAADLDKVQALGSGTRRDAFSAVTQARDLGAAATRLPFFDAPFAVIFLALVWFIGGLLVVIPLAVLLAFSLAALHSSSGLRRAAEARAGAEQALASRLADLLTGIVDLKGFGRAGRLMNRLDRPLRDYAVEAEGFERRTSLLLDLSQVASLLATVAITVAGAILVVSGGLTTGGLAACSILAGRGVGAGLGLFSSLARRGAARAAGDHVAALRRSLGPDVDPAGPDRPLHAPADLVLEAVTLARGHARVPPVSARLAAGSIVRVDGDVAPARLLLLAAAGFERPDGGRIAPSLAATYVPEQPTLFVGSILDNLTGWQGSRATQARQLAADLGLAPLIDRLPDGVRGEVTGGLVPELSAGAVKRIALVRALCQAVPLVVLDNPEVGLDIEGRRRLATVLAARPAGTTILLRTADPALAALASETLSLAAPAARGMAAA